MSLDLKKSNNLLPCDGEVYYFNNLFSDLNCEELQNDIEWRQDKIKLYGKEHLIPRLHQWYALDNLTYTYSKILLEPLEFTPMLFEVLLQVNELSNIEFNSVLCNLYRDGQDSNGWHSDNEKELGDNPPIASISLGAKRKFVLKHRKKDLKVELELDNGSFLIMLGETQHHWLHTITKTKKVDQARLNLTFRKTYPIN